MKKIILIVGASGVGKDSLLKESENYFGDKINYVRRCITRKPDDNEGNYYLNDFDFDVLRQKDFFVSTWEAHDNFYGISKDSIKDGVNIISISRAKISDFQEQFDDVYTINITLSKEELKNRLIKRARESIEDIEKRLNRNYEKITAKNLIEFDNSKEFIVSSNEFKKLLEEIIKK